MEPVEPGSRPIGDEELTAIGIGTTVRHSEEPGLIKNQAVRDLIFKGITWSTGTGTRRIASLGHETSDHPVKGGVVVESGFRQENEVIHGDRRKVIV